MRILMVITGLILMVVLFSRCNNPGSKEVLNMKDLSHNMLDMKMYHENLGTHLRLGDAAYASWLLEGMDSSLKVIAVKFDEHRKLSEPFEKAYKKRLLPSIKNIRNELNNNNLPGAIKAYSYLTYKCNGCHIDHDVDKEVFDLSSPAYNKNK
jgi:hypothetical protein